MSLTASPGGKTFRDGTHRVCKPLTTLERIVPKARAFGLTRVANVTGLDYLGIPVAMAIRPNSHNLSTYQGKGVSLEAAKASAVMEAYECACAEAPAADPVWAASRALDRKQCLVPRGQARTRLPADEPIPWLAGTDLLSGQPVLVPEEAVSMDMRVPHRPGFGRFHMSSNGLASGNTRDEAILHALCELLERDAIALWRLAPATRQQATRVDFREVASAAVQFLAACYDAAGIHVAMWDVTSDIGVPAFFCLIDDRDSGPPYLGRFGGAGCHPAADVAMCRALSEAAQSRLTFIVGTRDDIAPDHYALAGWDRGLSTLSVPLEVGGPRAGISAPSLDTADVASDVAVVLARLAAAAIDRLACVELTRADIGMPCVRVIAPALEGMSHATGYRRGPRARRALRTWC